MTKALSIYPKSFETGLSRHELQHAQEAYQKWINCNIISKAMIICPRGFKTCSSKLSDDIYKLFPEAAKMKKQMNYADKNNIPYVVLMGKNEIEQNVLSVKNMKTGEQKEMGIEEFIGLVMG